MVDCFDIDFGILMLEICCGRQTQQMTKNSYRSEMVQAHSLKYFYIKKMDPFPTFLDTVSDSNLIHKHKCRNNYPGSKKHDSELFLTVSMNK